MDIYFLTKKDNYINNYFIEKKINILTFDYNKLNFIDYIKNINIIIICDYEHEKLDNIFKILIDNKTIIFSNIKTTNNHDYIYFENDDKLIIYLESYLNNKDKSFTVIIPIYNSYDYLHKSVESVLTQNHKNYKIFLCDDYSNLEEIEKIKLYQGLNNISIYKNDKNIGKFATINKILNKITTDYYLILDSDDTIISNRLTLDLIYFGLNKQSHTNIYAVRSKYIRTDINNKIIEKKYGHNAITFKTDVINKIGFYYPNRFGSDTEFIMRLKKFIGINSIINYKNITYNAIIRKDKKNLTKIYDVNKRKKFIKFIHNIYKIPNCLEFMKNNLFDNLEKEISNIYDDSIDYLNILDYKKFYLDVSNMNNTQIIEHWENIGCKENRLPNENIFYKKFPNFNYTLYLKKYISEIKFNTKYEVFGWVFLKKKTNYFKWLIDNKYIINNKLLDTINNNSSYKVNINEFILMNNIKFIYVSNYLQKKKDLITSKLNLLTYDSTNDKFENTIFIGLYNLNDYFYLTNHLGNKYLIYDEREQINVNLLDRIKKYPDITRINIDDKYNKCKIFI